MLTLHHLNDSRSQRILWLLEELPKDRNGYRIVYGELAGMFGLAVPGASRDVFIGYYGSFLDTYRGM